MCINHKHSDNPSSHDHKHAYDYQIVRTIILCIYSIKRKKTGIHQIKIKLHILGLNLSVTQALKNHTP